MDTQDLQDQICELETANEELQKENDRLSEQNRSFLEKLSDIKLIVSKLK